MNSTQPHRRPRRIVILRMVDPAYPRSARMLAFLSADRGLVTHRIVPTTRGGIAAQWLGEALHLFRATRRGDLILLAEMQLKFAPVAALVGAVRRCPVIVDGFIGMYETSIQDWGVAPAGSFRARRYRMQDALARRAARLFLIDTDVRAAAIRDATRGRTTALSLPVGAPTWATPSAPRPRSDQRLRVLYYGNYIPLHGLPTVVDAIDLARRSVSIDATFIGHGTGRAAIEAAVAERGLADTITFLDAVPEAELANAIAGHDVVLGVFGTSPKAGSVIANKVWQGLACSRRVVTRSSPALLEIASIAGGLLIETPPGDARGLAEALVQCGRTTAPFDPGIATRLEQHVRSRYEEFRSSLHAL